MHDEGGCPVAVLSDERVEAELGQRSGWERREKSIVKSFGDRGGFVGSVGFVNAILEPAEEMDHHPDLAISWDTVTVTLSTHSEGGVTEKDLALADTIDTLA